MPQRNSGGRQIDEIELDGFDLEPTGLTNPLTGVPVNTNDVDELIDCFEHVSQVANECYAVKRRAAEMLLKMTSGDKKTRRIEGTRRRAKIELASDSWDNKQLRAVWDKCPDLRDRCLKIEKIGVQITEYKKLTGTTGTPELNDFVAAVVAANRGPTGTPTITVEA